MVLLPSIFLSAFFLVLAVLIAAGICLLAKCGLSLLSYKLKIENWKRLWIPFVGSWHDGMLIGRYMGLKPGRNPWKLILTLGRLIPFLVYVVVLIDINIVNPPIGDANFEGVLMWVFAIDLYIVELLVRVLKTIAMLKSKCGVVKSFIVGVLLPDFWSFFMLGKKPN